MSISPPTVPSWDLEMVVAMLSCGMKLRKMAGHQGEVATLSWYQFFYNIWLWRLLHLASRCPNSVVIPKHKFMELLGHTRKVCGLKWRNDGEFLQAAVMITLRTYGMAGLVMSGKGEGTVRGERGAA